MAEESSVGLVSSLLWWLSCDEVGCGRMAVAHSVVWGRKRQDRVGW